MREAVGFRRVIGLDSSLLVLSKSAVALNYSAFKSATSFAFGGALNRRNLFVQGVVIF